MKFMNVLQALYCEPWLVVPEMHKRICQIVDAHIDGSAHASGGILAQFDDDKKAANEMTITDGVAVIPVHGVIGKRVSMLERSSGVIDVDEISRRMEIALEDDSVDSVFMHIDSPGGTVTGVPETASLIAQVAAEMPVVAFTDRLMASAAMWLAAGATEIIASQSAVVGSIGVYMAFLDMTRNFEMNGVKTELFKQGKFKAMGLEGTALTDDQRQHLQAGVDQVFSWFASHVQAHRVVAADSMEGQTFHAEEARARGLIDAVGTEADAMAELNKLRDM